MTNTNINVRTDLTTKQNAEKVFNSLGMNMSTAINVFLRQCIRENGIPFIISNEIKDENISKKNELEDDHDRQF